jgi:hypothetical protein
VEAGLGEFHRALGGGLGGLRADDDGRAGTVPLMGVTRNVRWRANRRSQRSRTAGSSSTRARVAGGFMAAGWFAPSSRAGKRTPSGKTCRPDDRQTCRVVARQRQRRGLAEKRAGRARRGRGNLRRACPVHRPCEPRYGYRRSWRCAHCREQETLGVAHTKCSRGCSPPPGRCQSWPTWMTESGFV